jgi:sulfur-carrier protein
VPPSRTSAEVIDLLPGEIPIYRRMMRDLPAMVARDPDRAREQLRRYFPRIVLRPTRDEGILAILNLTAEQLLEMGDCTVRIGSPLRSYTNGAASVAAAGGTVAEVLADLDRRYPGMRFRMIDEQDRIRRHVRVFVNNREAATLTETVAGGDQVHLICALSGG